MALDPGDARPRAHLTAPTSTADVARTPGLAGLPAKAVGAADLLATFARVPLFYYLLHIPLIHVASRVRIPEARPSSWLSFL